MCTTSIKNNTKFCGFVLYSIALCHLSPPGFHKYIIISSPKDTLIIPFLCRCLLCLPFSGSCQDFNTMLSVMVTEGTLALFLLGRDSPFYIISVRSFSFFNKETLIQKPFLLKY